VPVTAEEDYILHVGENKTFTICNFHWNTTGYGLCIGCDVPSWGIAHTEYNLAQVISFINNRGDFWDSEALIGIKFIPEFNGYTWNEIKNIPIIVNIRGVFNASAHYSLNPNEWGGSSHAYAAVKAPQFSSPGIEPDSCIYYIGEVDETSGDAWGDLWERFDKNSLNGPLVLGNLYNNKTYIMVHSFASREGDYVESNAEATVIIHSISIEFPTPLIMDTTVSNGLPQYEGEYKGLVFRRGQDQPKFEVKTIPRRFTDGSQVQVEIYKTGEPAPRCILTTEYNSETGSYIGYLDGNKDPFWQESSTIPVGNYTARARIARPGGSTFYADEEHTGQVNFYVIFDEESTYLEDRYIFKNDYVLYIGGSPAPWDRIIEPFPKQYSLGVTDPLVFNMAIKTIDGVTSRTVAAQRIIEKVHYENPSSIFEAGWAEPPDQRVFTNNIPTILRNYSKEGKQPGQCFTMGATTTALLRSAGIPARAVTAKDVAGVDWEPNVDVLVDWQNGITEKCIPVKNNAGNYIIDDEKIEQEFWNYHVWNEMLGEGQPTWTANYYVLDSTYGFNPVPVNSIKNYVHNNAPDTNAGRIHNTVCLPIEYSNVLLSAGGEVESKRVFSSSSRTTYELLTAGQNGPVDIIGNYLDASHVSGFNILESEEDVVSIELSAKPAWNTGDDGFILANIANHDDTALSCSAVISVYQTDYTGSHVRSVTNASESISIPAHSMITRSYPVLYSEYQENGEYSVTFILINETDDTFIDLAETAFPIHGLTVTFTMPATVDMNQTFEGTVHIGNPLPLSLHNVRVTVDCPPGCNVTEPASREFSILAPGETQDVTWTLRPERSGILILPVLVTCDELESQYSTGMTNVTGPSSLVFEDTGYIPVGSTSPLTNHVQFRVKNIGDLPASGVVVNLAPPTGVTANMTTWTVGTLGGKENATISVALTSETAGDYFCILNATDSTGESIHGELFLDYPADETPPGSVTQLHNLTYASTLVNWSWTEPADPDLARVMVYLDGAFRTNVSKGTCFYAATGLTPNTLYTIGTHTVDTSGNVNFIWVNHTARTAPSAVFSAKVGVYRSSDHTFYLRPWNYPTTPTLKIPWGTGSDIPVTGDWDGDGTTEVGIYRPSDHTFYLRPWNYPTTPTLKIPWGTGSDIPVTGALT